MAIIRSGISNGNTGTATAISASTTSNGTVELSGANTYTGVTQTNGAFILANSSGRSIDGNLQINGGTTTVASASQFASSSNVTISGGSFSTSAPQTMGSLTFNAGSVSTGTQTLSLAGTGTVLSMRNTTLSSTLALTSATSGNTIVYDPTNAGTATLSGASLSLGGVGCTFNVVHNGSNT
ncbi:MAG: hypothetical protein ACHQT8_05475, partial [Chlamydiales bacterium]